MFWPCCQKFQKFRLHVSEIEPWPHLGISTLGVNTIEPWPHLEISTLDVNRLNARTIR